MLGRTLCTIEGQRTLAQLEEVRRSWDQAPRTQGRIELIVVRPQRDTRSCIEFAELDLAQGLIGDRWVHARRTRDAQLSLMDVRVARALEDRERWPLFGDNLIVDLDLSVDALPAGTRLAVGTACVEITAELHLGCRKFTARFGKEAQQWVNHKSRRELRLRGIYAKVIAPGLLRVGDQIRKLER